jgi:hypothetical protein
MEAHLYVVLFQRVAVVADLFESGTDVVSYHAAISSTQIHVVSEATQGNSTGASRL